MESGVGCAVGLTERMVAAVLGVDAPLDRTSVARTVGQLAAREAPLASQAQLQAVVDSIVGLGPVEVLLRDPEVTDVLVNGPGEVWVERRGSLSRADIGFESDAAILAAVERVIGPLGLRLDRSSPMVDARLPDGSRLHAVIPPAAVSHPVFAVRRFTQAVPDLDAFVEKGGVDPAMGAALADAVREGRCILISGGTGTGKTTLLNLLSALIPAGERVVVVEDASELALRGHVVRLEAHPPNIEGRGEVGLEDLMRSALRLRPDRIVLGEVRGREAVHLLTAINTGHRGSMSTIHANSPDEAMLRLEMLVLTGAPALPQEVVRRQLRAGIEVVIQLGRREGARRVVEVAGL